MVPLRNVSTVSSSTGPTAIRRVNRQPQVVVGANFYGRTQASVTRDVQARLNQLKLPPGVTIGTGSQQQMTNDSFGALLFSMVLSVVFVYMGVGSSLDLSPSHLFLCWHCRCRL